MGRPRSGLAHNDLCFFGKVAGKWFEKKFKIVDEFSLELDHFAACIRADRDPLPDGNAALRDAIVVEAIYEAAKQGRPVLVNVPGKFNSQRA